MAIVHRIACLNKHRIFPLPGAALMVLAVGAFSGMQVAARQVHELCGMHPLALVFWRCVLAAPWMLWGVRRRHTRVLPAQPGLLLVRSVLGSLAMGCMFYGVAHMPMAQMGLLSRTQPIFVALIAAVLLREKISTRVVWATFVSFAGVVLVLRPWRESLVGLEMLAVLAVFASATASAGAHVTVRKLTQKDVPMRIVTWFLVFSGLLTAYWGLTAIPQILGPAVMWRLVALSACATAGQWWMTMAYQRAPAAVVAAAGYISVLWAALWGYGLWGEVLPVMAWVGALGVVGGGVLLFAPLRLQQR